MSNTQSLKTLSGIALALLVGYYLFRVQALLHAVTALVFLAAFPCRLSRIVADGWTRFGEALGAVNSRIVLTLIYFLVLTPVALCYRRLNPKMVGYFRGGERESYFVDSNAEFTREIFEKTW